MRSGRLRHAATIERQSTTPDSFGQLVDTWSTIAHRTVSVEPLNGREYFNASGESSEITTRIRMRYDEDTAEIKPFDRIMIDGRTYDIVSVINVQQRNRELVLMCRL
jgi:SPP1 family predicted phage head-tail adaptor